LSPFASDSKPAFVKRFPVGGGIWVGVAVLVGV